MLRGEDGRSVGEWEGLPFAVGKVRVMLCVDDR